MSEPTKIVFSTQLDPTSWEPSCGHLNVWHPAIARWLVRHPRVCWWLLKLLRRI